MSEIVGSIRDINQGLPVLYLALILWVLYFVIIMYYQVFMLQITLSANECKLKHPFLDIWQFYPYHLQVDAHPKNLVLLFSHFSNLHI